MEKITVSEFLKGKDSRVLLDVRSPGEYESGHIPGAVSFPLFSDEERAVVGTLYKKKGHDAALLKGLEFVGLKMADYVRLAGKLVPDKKLYIHCWRGGQRSASMAWLLETAGFDVQLISGGYKAFRKYIHQQFEDSIHPFIVLGGPTGSGKTAILQALGELGEQIINLEALAHHKGSAFGSIGEPAQPSVEQFENNLFEVFHALDNTKRTWVENESRSIGRVFQPQGFWQQFRKSIYIGLVIPFEDRLKNLVQQYGAFPKEALIESFIKINKKLGGQHVQAAIAFLEQGDVTAAGAIALKYYDKSYPLANAKCDFSRSFLFTPDLAKGNMEIARSLIKFSDRNEL
jgi:tRNA 2-selenouridine synthase